jgi:hypothetical protein
VSGYDRWKTEAPDEELSPEEQDELDARAEDAAIEKAERQREDRMFDEADRLEGS